MTLPQLRTNAFHFLALYIYLFFGSFFKDTVTVTWTITETIVIEKEKNQQQKTRRQTQQQRKSHINTSIKQRQII